MDVRPPNGSTIAVTTEGADTVIVVPHGSGSVMRYFVGLFLLFWLGGWFVALSNTVPKVMSGNAPPFLFFWLGGWTVGGLFAMVFLYQVVRPSIPESLRLTHSGVIYDSGRPPFQFQYYHGQRSAKDAWKSIFPKRMLATLERRKLQTLRLRETPEGNRLTVDADSQRLDIAQSAGEVEREWLYQVLAKRYALAPAPDVAPGTV
jgi:hypothetical protein